MTLQQSTIDKLEELSVLYKNEYNRIGSDTTKMDTDRLLWDLCHQSNVPKETIAEQLGIPLKDIEKRLWQFEDYIKIRR